jgi:hypothetical protein
MSKQTKKPPKENVDDLMGETSPEEKPIIRVGDTVQFFFNPDVPWAAIVTGVHTIEVLDLCIFRPDATQNTIMLKVARRNKVALAKVWDLKA